MVSVDIEIMLYMRRQLGCDKSLGQFIIDKLFMVSIFFYYVVYVGSSKPVEKVLWEKNLTFLPDIIISPRSVVQ